MPASETLHVTQMDGFTQPSLDEPAQTVWGMTAALESTEQTASVAATAETENAK